MLSSRIFIWRNQHDPTLGNHCPADTKLCPWYDFRIESAWVNQTWTKLQNGQVGPALRCNLMNIIGVSRLSIYPDWMHDKNLGTDKATWAHTFLQIVLYTLIYSRDGEACLTVVWMRGGARVGACPSTALGLLWQHDAFTCSCHDGWRCSCEHQGSMG